MDVPDTNVLSELVKPRPDVGLVERVLGAPKGSLFASEITRCELRAGAARHANPAPMWASIQAPILTVPTGVPVSGTPPATSCGSTGLKSWTGTWRNN